MAGMDVSGVSRQRVYGGGAGVDRDAPPPCGKLTPDGAIGDRSPRSPVPRSPRRVPLSPHAVVRMGAPSVSCPAMGRILLLLEDRRRRHAAADHRPGARRHRGRGPVAVSAPARHRAPSSPGVWQASSAWGSSTTSSPSASSSGARPSSTAASPLFSTPRRPSSPCWSPMSHAGREAVPPQDRRHRPRHCRGRGAAGRTGALGAPGALWGVAACLGAALSYGFANTFGRRFRSMGLEPSATAFGQLLASSVMALPLVLIIDSPGASPCPAGASGLP